MSDELADAWFDAQAIPYRSRPPVPSLESYRGPIGLRSVNSPPESQLELVFVHGLMGDSKLTWTFGGDLSTYWPEWLAEDEAFCKTRIHTYGYGEPVAADGRIAVGQLRQLGMQLCSAIDSNTDLRRDNYNPIVFIAHSLGGLLVKAAITYAKQSGKFQELGKRFHSVIFLATPHRNASDQHMLRKILHSCNTSIFISPEPEPNTSQLQEINDTFSLHSQDIGCWCFYESSPDTVVDKNFAILGNELPRRANANHANIVRFQSSSDPTYASMAEILRGLARDILEELENPDKVEAQMRILAKFLNVPDNVDADLANNRRERVVDSCEWLTRKESFQRWRDCNATAWRTEEYHQTYWLSGDPGCGKSFLAAHVVDHFHALRRNTCYFFFKHGDMAKRTISDLLRTMAYQMARVSVSLRRSFLSMQREDSLSDGLEEIGTVWKQLYLQRAFRVNPDRRQYWVIDALDESQAFDELISRLAAFPANYRILITSRRDNELDRAFRQSEAKVFSSHIDRNETLGDIRAYLESIRDDLPADNRSQQEVLIHRLLKKSKGSFLWTRLTVQALWTSWTSDVIEKVLDEVPSGMYPLYDYLLRKVSASPNSALAETIFRWIICATRPMTTTELRTAVDADSKRRLLKAPQAIQDICGYLLRIENNRIDVSHDTVREYLFTRHLISPSAPGPGFKFDKAASNQHVAGVCVSYMSKVFSRANRMTLLSSARSESDDPFLDYASKNFSEHLARSGWTDETMATRTLVEALIEFFRGPIFSWIEFLAQRSSENSLSALTGHGKNLKAFVARRMRKQVALSTQLHELLEWADDIIHLVSTFGKDLSRKPDAIHDIIPMLCPPLSKISQISGRSRVGLYVVGLPRTSWPERIHSSPFPKDWVTALASNEEFYAVSLRSKQIVVYRAATCQETYRIETQERILNLQFAHDREWLVAFGRNTLAVYNYQTGENLWVNDTLNGIVALALSQNDTEIILVTREKDLRRIDVEHGTPITRLRLERSRTRGHQVCISVELALVALFARNEEVEIYDLDKPQRPTGRIEHAADIRAIVFNTPKKMMAVASFDGILSIIEVQALNTVSTRDANASHLAVSADGKTLVLGTPKGKIQIHEFDTLEMLHLISYDDIEVLGLCFAGNNLRFLDIRPQVFNVWEPAALVRRSDYDDSGSSSGQSLFTSAPSQHLEVVAKIDKTAISALVEHHSGDYVFCAKESGAVLIYDTTRGKPKHKLFDFGSTDVLFLAWNKPRNLLASADNSSTVKVHQVLSTPERAPTGAQEAWQVKMSFQTTLNQPIRQVLFSLDGKLLLVSTTLSECVFRTKDGKRLLVHHHDSAAGTATQRLQKWVTWNKRQFVDVQSGHSISWEAEEPVQPTIIPMKFAEQLQAQTKQYGRATLIPIGSQTRVAYDSNPSSAMVVWSRRQGGDSSPISETGESAISRTFAKVASFLGFHRDLLIFLDFDNWVCSFRVDDTRSDEPSRDHFPLPHYWTSVVRPLLAFVSVKGDIVIAVDGDLAIVKNAW